MIVNDLLWSLRCLNMRLICFLWSSIVLFKASVAQKMCHLALYDRHWSSTKPQSLIYVFLFLFWYRQWYLTKPRLPKYVSYIGRFNDHQWSLTNHRSPKYMSYLDSMISYYASVTQKCVLFVFYDRKWSLTKPRSPKKVFFLWSSMICCESLEC